MSDMLVDLGANKSARKFITSLGLPIPLPQKLARATGPWLARPLEDRVVAVAAAPGATLGEVIAPCLGEAGADVVLCGFAPEARAAYLSSAEAWARKIREAEMDEVGERFRPAALLLDASGLTDTEGLRALYDFFKPRVRALARQGRVVVLGRPPESAETAAGAAAQAALEGFVRSVAKEIGRKGATANLIYVAPKAEHRLGPVLRFLLSDRSCYISGQPIRVSHRAQGKVEPRFTLPLEGKVALVTGAARGIGASTARRLSEEGAKVICLDRPDDDAPLSQTAHAIDAETLLCDVTNPDAPKIIRDAVISKHGGVDIVVHNAGITRDKTLGNMKELAWDLTLDVNLKAIIRMTDALLEEGMNSKGRLIYLSSIAGLAGNVGQTNYSASKAGIAGYVQALGAVVAKRGITANAIAPGFIETRLTAAIPAMTREVARRLAALSQGGLPLDIAEAVTFLASPGAQGVSAQILRVCGGNFVGR